MGVSLERVQNKFACIIGELCSEPVVLSQFAVWVDLRIAEYKTNGTISLDCSGDSPNPNWMKGVKNGPQRGSSNSMDTGQGHHHRRGSFTNSSNVKMSPSASPLSNQIYINERLQSTESQNSSSVFPSRLSPDIVVIKEEPGSDQISCSLSRKRQPESDLQSDYYSPAKSRRHGNASFSSPAQESSSNQSLMSIINTETDSIALEAVENEGEIFKVTMEMQDELNQSQGLHPSNLSNSTFSPRRPSATATSTSNSPVQSAWPTYASDPQQGTSSQAAILDGLTGSAYLEGGTLNQVQGCTYGLFSNENVSSIHNLSFTRPGLHLEKDCPVERIRDVVNKSFSAIKNIQSAVRVFERWVSSPPYNDSRNIEDITPAKLNLYLRDFFTHHKRPQGEYNPIYLGTFRSSLDRYLQDYQYPHCIKTSDVFRASQGAFKQRKLLAQESQIKSTSTSIEENSR